MVALTLSGNEITDATRAAAIQGDGVATPDSSFGMWEAITNKVTNGGFETNLTDWSKILDTGETLTRITTDYKFGIACMQVDIPAGGTQGAAFGAVVEAVPQNDIWTASVWLKAKTGGDVGKTVEIYLNATGSADSSFASCVLTADWKRFSTTTTFASAGGTGWYVHVRSNAAQAVGILVDGLQVEIRPMATPYVETDGATAARTAARIRTAVAGLVNATQSWVALRLRMGWVNTADPSATPTLFQWKDDANNLIELRFDTATDQWKLQRRDGGGTGVVTFADTFALSDFITVIAAWDSGNLKLSIDGSVFTSVAGTNIPALAATTADIGSSAGSAQHIDSDIKWFACGTGTLTDAQAATIHAFGNTDPTLQDLPGAPTLVWPANTGTAIATTEASVAAPWHQRRGSRW